MAISKLLLVLVVTFAVVTSCESQTTQLDQGRSQELGNVNGENIRMGNCPLQWRCCDVGFRGRYWTCVRRDQQQEIAYIYRSGISQCFCRRLDARH